jgi:hypothetical protein
MKYQGLLPTYYQHFYDLTYYRINRYNLSAAANFDLQTIYITYKHLVWLHLTTNILRITYAVTYACNIQKLSISEPRLTMV